VHPPAWHRTIVADIYAHNGLDRQLGPEEPTPLTGRTRWSVTEHDDHNESTVVLERLGADVVAVLAGVLAEEADRGRDLVHVELSLADPATAALPVAVHDDLDVFFGGVVPELRDGDVLRLQWLNGVEADPSDVAVASDFGRELLDYVFERKGTGSR
jgi:serine/threonine-protein kinase RsbW